MCDINYDQRTESPGMDTANDIRGYQYLMQSLLFYECNHMCIPFYTGVGISKSIFSFKDHNYV